MKRKIGRDKDREEKGSSDSNRGKGIGDRGFFLGGE